MARKQADDDTGISGKRKKSWRELDAARGKSKYGSRQDDAQQQRLENSPNYGKALKAADALFTPGAPLPDAVAGQLDPDNKRQAQKDAMLRVTEAGDRKLWTERVVEYFTKYPDMPEDPYFLDSLLDHPKDRIVDKALAKLEALGDDGKLVRAKTPRSLEQRLRSLEMTSLDTDVQQRAKALRTKLAAL